MPENKKPSKKRPRRRQQTKPTRDEIVEKLFDPPLLDCIDTLDEFDHPNTTIALHAGPWLIEPHELGYACRAQGESSPTVVAYDRTVALTAAAVLPALGAARRFRLGSVHGKHTLLEGDVARAELRYTDEEFVEAFNIATAIQTMPESFSYYFEATGAPVLQLVARLLQERLGLRR